MMYLIKDLKLPTSLKNFNNQTPLDAVRNIDENS